ncbi:hypothetical protein BGP77_15075 [Saccharospirillum sp. MSK14-1]|uniref:SRPBCC family protein n=1 Tax=Saccharospirillum sp. MSK14-1 TaxID=1897632 RepID=UPI000D3970BB|nr:SRPBCC family protein [Saccharospirillum sp. MSK14-1]PTY37797.1 hypothetical protein BGP77_15075 [Saccharospirillum sp. MSK14-1]
MKYSVHVDIKRPRDEVVELFDNPDHLPTWQPDLIELEPIAGIPGQPDSQVRLVYRMGKREMEMIETVLERHLPERIAMRFETSGMSNQMVNRFEDLGGSTRWHADNEFIGTGWMKLMTWFLPGAFRKESLKTMRRFKKFVESRSPDER